MNDKNSKALQANLLISIQKIVANNMASSGTIYISGSEEGMGFLLRIVKDLATQELMIRIVNCKDEKTGLEGDMFSHTEKIPLKEMNMANVLGEVVYCMGCIGRDMLMDENHKGYYQIFQDQILTPLAILEANLQFSKKGNKRDDTLEGEGGTQCPTIN